MGKAQYIETPLNFAWDIVETSHIALDSVLNFERNLTDQFGSDKKYSYENRGAVTMKVYSEEFTRAYNASLHGMVERRMRKSIHSVGSLWYTAWIKAGKPDLSILIDQSISSKLEEEIKKNNEARKSNKIKGRQHDD